MLGKSSTPTLSLLFLLANLHSSDAKEFSPRAVSEAARKDKNVWGERKSIDDEK